ncbi:hypothetical protein BN903_137 [Halorubrum sp. AJ67]|nr:hypothetical protein BN903_137 [Halorubrum sp. AJ67]
MTEERSERLAVSQLGLRRSAWEKQSRRKRPCRSEPLALHQLQSRPLRIERLGLRRSRSRQLRHDKPL